jgi:hypothetical protein
MVERKPPVRTQLRSMGEDFGGRKGKRRSGVLPYLTTAMFTGAVVLAR